MLLPVACAIIFGMMRSESLFILTISILGIFWLASAFLLVAIPTCAVVAEIAKFLVRSLSHLRQRGGGQSCASL
jgi:hypothetical protein